MTPSAHPHHRRRRLRGLVSALGAVAVTAIGLSAVGAAPPAWAASAVSLSQSTDLDPAGQTITVRGSGFDSTRGIYLMFCRQVGASGTPQGRPTGTDCAPAQAWVTAPGPMVPPTGTVPWTGAGTFEVDLAVASTFGSVDCRAAGTTCGVVTRNDHREGGAYDQDSFTPVSFAADPDPTTTTTTTPEEPAGPTLAISPTSDLDAAGTTVAVVGTGFPEGQGVYVRFCATPAGPVGTVAARPPAATCDGDGLWVTPDPPPGVDLPEIVDGAFSVDLPVMGAFAGADDVVDCTAAGSCGVFVRRDHNGGAADATLDSFTPVSFDPATEPPVIDDPDDPDPTGTSIEVAPSEDLVDGQTVTVTGEGFTEDQGVYVQYCANPQGAPGTPAGRATSCYPEQDGTHTVWFTPIPAGGTFTTPLTVVASFTDADGDLVDCTEPEACGVFVRRDHNGGTADLSQDAFAPVSFGDGDPVVPEVPTLVADRTEGLDPDGDSLVLEGDAFRPGDRLYVALCDADVANFAACDYEQLVEVTPAATTRASGEAGSFQVTLPVRARFGDTDCAVTSCAVQTWAVSGGDASSEVTLPVTFAASTVEQPTTTEAPGTTDAAPPSDAAGPVGSGTLARTGSDPRALAAFGLAVVGVGVAISTVSRRRRAAA